MTDVTLKRYAGVLTTCRLPVVDVAIEPASPEAPLSAVVEIVLVPASENNNYSNHHHNHSRASADGAACSSGCGYCGRCSDGPRNNATCPDCRAQFVKWEHDSDDLCDECRDQRDAYTDALEIRFGMAKAGLPADQKKEIA